MGNKKRLTPDALTALIMREARLKRFILVGETTASKALVVCWNGKEYQNQIDTAGLLALGLRAYATAETFFEEVPDAKTE